MAYQIRMKDGDTRVQRYSNAETRVHARVEMPELTAGYEWESPRKAKGKRRCTGGTWKGASVAAKRGHNPF